MARDTEAVIIMEGVVNFLENPISVFIRFKRAVTLADLPEVDISTRFMYLFAAAPNVEIPQAQIPGPEDKAESQYSDIGISLATAFTDKEFVSQMYSAQTKEEVLEALDDYTHGIRVLPREWQADHTIEPPQKSKKKLLDEIEEIDEDRRYKGFKMG